jgi:hypothetical protein
MIGIGVGVGIGKRQLQQHAREAGGLFCNVEDWLVFFYFF